MTVQTLTTAGAALGALTSGNLAHLGLRNCLLISNIILSAGCLLPLAFHSFNILCLSRLIYGTSVGAFSVYCPKYISVITPLEIRGPAGALT